MKTSEERRASYMKEKRRITNSPVLWVIIIILALLIFYSLGNKKISTHEIRDAYYNQSVKAFNEINDAFHEGRFVDETVSGVIADDARAIEKNPENYSAAEIYINDQLVTMLLSVGKVIDFGPQFADEFYRSRENLIELLELEQTGDEASTDSNAKEGSELNQAGQTVTDWSIYKNNRFGYTVKYPASWTLGEEVTNGDGLILLETDGAELLIFGSHDSEDYPFDLSGYELLSSQGGNDFYVRVESDGDYFIYNGIVFHQDIIINLSGIFSQELFQQYGDLLNDILLDMTFK